MQSTAPASESINRRFRVIVTVIYVTVIVLVLWVFLEQWKGYRDARQARYEFAALEAILETMGDISTERRKTFVVLEEEGLTPQQELTTLDTARRTTDARFELLSTALHDTRCRACKELIPSAERARWMLDNARRELDALRQVLPKDRTDEATVRAFDHMLGIIPALASMADHSATGVIRENADVQSYLLTAGLSALLREHAGMLGSQFGPALSGHRALTQEELFDIGRTLGKIDQLLMLLGSSVQNLPPSLKTDFRTLSKLYFGEGLGYINQLRIDAARPGGTDVTTTQLTEHYGPTLLLINHFRDDALTLAHNRINQSLENHLMLVVGAGLLASILTAVLLFTLWRFRERIVRPYIEARRLILAIASGDLSMPVPTAAYNGEIKDMFGALNVLRQHSEERLRLEQERHRLIGELRTMAETDALTGLLNRRAFEAKATALLKDQRGATHVLALVMLDIDHFKKINDTYGHETGDRALVKLAALCHDTLRANDIVARMGGEEFTLLLCLDDASQARGLAERLRTRLHGETITAVDGREFRMTASFGITVVQRSHPPSLDELLRRADALLYQAKEGGRDRIESDA